MQSSSQSVPAAHPRAVEPVVAAAGSRGPHALSLNEVRKELGLPPQPDALIRLGMRSYVQPYYGSFSGNPQPVYQPTTVYLDKYEFVSKLKWRNWGSQRATGTGTDYIHTCYPGPCSSGGNYKRPASFRLKNIRRCAARQQYTSIQRTWTGRSIPGGADAHRVCSGKLREGLMGRQQEEPTRLLTGSSGGSGMVTGRRDFNRHRR